MWKVKLLRPKPSISRPLVFAYGSQNRYPTHEMLSEHVLELTWMLQLKPFTSDFYDDLFGVVIPFLWGYLTKLVSRQPPSARPREPAWNLTMMTDPRLDISTKPQIPFLQMRTLFHALVLFRMGVATPFFGGGSSEHRILALSCRRGPAGGSGEPGELPGTTSSLRTMCWEPGEKRIEG